MILCKVMREGILSFLAVNLVFMCSAVSILTPIKIFTYIITSKNGLNLQNFQILDFY